MDIHIHLHTYITLSPVPSFSTKASSWAQRAGRHGSSEYIYIYVYVYIYIYIYIYTPTHII